MLLGEKGGGGGTSTKSEAKTKALYCLGQYDNVGHGLIFLLNRIFKVLLFKIPELEIGQSKLNLIILLTM